MLFPVIAVLQWKFSLIFIKSQARAERLISCLLWLLGVARVWEDQWWLMALWGTWWCLLLCALKRSFALLSEETFKRMEKQYSVNVKRQLSATKLEPGSRWETSHFCMQHSQLLCFVPLASFGVLLCGLLIVEPSPCRGLQSVIGHKEPFGSWVWWLRLAHQARCRIKYPLGCGHLCCLEPADPPATSASCG